MKEHLLKADNLAFTTDLWKNQTNEFFLALTVHFFDDDLVYHSLLFSFRKFKKLHFSTNIRKFIIKEIGTDLLLKVLLKFNLSFISIIYYLLMFLIDSVNYFR